MQKQAGDKSGLGYNMNEESSSISTTQSCLENNNFKSMKGLGYVEPDKSKSRWTKPRSNWSGYGLERQRTSSTQHKPHSNNSYRKYWKSNRNNQYDHYTWHTQHNAQRSLDKSVIPKGRHHGKPVNRNELIKQAVWYLDSGCSRHMTGDRRMLSDYIPGSGHKIFFGDNSKGTTMGKGKLIPGNIRIKDVLLVENLKYNLISISQLCDYDYCVEFQKHTCIVKDQSGLIIMIGERSGNTYKGCRAQRDNSNALGHGRNGPPWSLESVKNIRRGREIPSSDPSAFLTKNAEKSLGCRARRDDSNALGHDWNGPLCSPKSAKNSRRGRELPSSDPSAFLTKNAEKSLNHLNFKALANLSKHELVTDDEEEIQIIKNREILCEPDQVEEQRPEEPPVDNEIPIDTDHVEPHNDQTQQGNTDHHYRWSKTHPPSLVIGNPSAPLRTRGQMINEFMHAAFISHIEPKNIEEALLDSYWIEAMQDELNQFERNYDFKVFQMDVKSAFLNGLLQEEVFVEQPPGFESKTYPDHVFKLDKALYGLKQAPRAWYDTLSLFLNDHGFTIGSNKFEMSMIGELTLFLGLQVRQMDKGIFINQVKYTKELLKKFGMENCSAANTPMSASIKLDKDEAGLSVDQTLFRGIIGFLLYLTASRQDIMFSVGLCARFQSDPKQSHYNAAKRILKYLKGTQNVGLWYPKDSSFNLIGYSDADYGGCRIDHKSTSGTCKFLGDRLISWFSKKQTSIATSTAESKYLAAESCCAPLLWIQHQLRDYGADSSESPISVTIQAQLLLPIILSCILEQSTLTFVITSSETM
ncbi:uncharacterized protein [Henckelia pumila]|uniref:uncharacterized protein n=1 Tax=Henckelia pumila TaxID=405737 RepID=UPI003C6DF6B1